MYEMEKIVQICKDWEYDFKGDLFTEVFDYYNNIADFITMLIDTYIPQWKEENFGGESLELYDKYITRLQSLDIDALQKEYSDLKRYYSYLR